MSDTATATAAGQPDGAVIIYPGGFKFDVQGDTVHMSPPLATGYAPFGVTMVPERDPNAPVSVLRFGSNGTIATISVGDVDEIGFRDSERQRVYESVCLVCEGDAGGPKRRRRLGRNPFFPTVVGDVYLMAEVENPDYDDDDDDHDDDDDDNDDAEQRDYFRCHLRVCT